MAFGTLLVSLCALHSDPLVTPTPWAVETAPPEAEVALSIFEHWQSLDDPSGDELPDALANLPHAGRAVFEATGEASLLFVRRLGEFPSLIDAFVADEEAMFPFGEFVPLADRAIELGEEEAFAFDCEWNFEELATRLTALYAPADDGTAIALWLVTTTDAPHAELEERLMEVLPHFRSSLRLAPSDRYTGIQLGHRVSFDLTYADDNLGRIALLPEDSLPGGETKFMDALQEVNPQFDTGVAHRWADPERGVTLSYQVMANNLGFGPESPFVHWIAGQFTAYYRIDKEKGDFPIDLYHRPNEQTHVVSEAEIERHYSNNVRAPESGVILQVYIPRSPYATSCQIEFRVEKKPEAAEHAPTPPKVPGGAPHGATAPPVAGPPHRKGISDESGSEAEGDVGQFGLVRFVQLRDYRRSRSETISRIAVVLLIARASTREELDLLDRELNLSTTPLYRKVGVLSNP